MTSSVLRLVVGDENGGQPTITDDAAGPRLHPHVMRYRLDVIAVDVADAVASVGGWLYDRAAGGWQVTVAVPGDQDDRPLLILGAQTVALDQALAEPVDAESDSVLAVGVAALTADTRVAHRVLAVLENGRGEVTAWGRPGPSIVGHRVRTAHHTLTSAARAFKAQSLAAAGVAGAAVTSTEAFHTHSSGSN